MKPIIVAIAILLSLSTHAQQQKFFGDRVVDCLVELKVNAESPDFDSKMNLCERRVGLDIKKEDWHQCIAKEVRKLDDQISPASDIAQAVASMCETEHDALLDGMTVSPQSKYIMRSDRVQSTKDVAVKIVLMLRAEARKAPPQKVPEEVSPPKPKTSKPLKKQKPSIEI